MRDAGAEFRHFEAALQVAQRIGDRLAMLHRDQRRQLFAMRIGKIEKFHHDARPHLRVLRCPGGLRRLGIEHGLIEFGLRGKRHFRLQLAGIRVEDVAETA